MKSIINQCYIDTYEHIHTTYDTNVCMMQTWKFVCMHACMHVCMYACLFEPRGFMLFIAKPKGRSIVTSVAMNSLEKYSKSTSIRGLRCMEYIHTHHIYMQTYIHTCMHIHMHKQQYAYTLKRITTAIATLIFFEDYEINHQCYIDTHVHIHTMYGPYVWHIHEILCVYMHVCMYLFMYVCMYMYVCVYVLCIALALASK